MSVINRVELLSDIAEVVGVDSRAIALIILLSNKKEALFRGVRDEGEWQSHGQHGIRAIGGDGRASFWTSGVRIFSASEDHLQQYDTTFFHYATGKKGVYPRMYITATSAPRINVDHSSDSLNIVNRNLSCGEFERLEVVGNAFGGYESLYPAMIEHLLNFCQSC